MLTVKKSKCFVPKTVIYTQLVFGSGVLGALLHLIFLCAVIVRIWLEFFGDDFTLICL